MSNFWSRQNDSYFHFYIWHWLRNIFHRAPNNHQKKIHLNEIICLFYKSQKKHGKFWNCFILLVNIFKIISNHDMYLISKKVKVKPSMDIVNTNAITKGLITWFQNDFHSGTAFILERLSFLNKVRSAFTWEIELSKFQFDLGIFVTFMHA